MPDSDVPVPSGDVPDPSAPASPTVAGSAVLRPVDVDGVGAVLYGTIAWAVALVACLLLRDRLTADGNAWWTWVCVAGVLLGLPGLWFVRRRRDASAARAG